MRTKVDLSELLGDLDTVSNQGSVNVTLLKILNRGQEKNFSLSLPENLNDRFMAELAGYLSQSAEKACREFDPVGNPDDDTYEWLPLENIIEKWATIQQMLTDAEDYKNRSDLAPRATLSISKFKFNGFMYYLGRKQTPIESLLKQKMVLMSANNELEDTSNKKMFLFSCDVDFVIREDPNGEGIVFLFNRKNFSEVFNYEESIKAKVEQNIHEIQNWNFLQSVDLIFRKINQKNVYRRLAKVFSNPEYMEQIKKTPAADLKKNLLERTDGNFTEADFSGELLVVTKSNLDKVMQMLAKGFRYNFFANRAEAE